MVEKLIKRVYNFFRIVGLHVKLKDRITMPLIQPMRINTQLMIQSNARKVTIGKNFRLETHAKVRVINGGELYIGDNVFINCNSYITAMGKISIGSGCLIGPGVMIFDHDHDYKAIGGIRSDKVKIGEITIGNNVWIGANSIILKGSIIHDDAVIAAGSIVNKEVPAHSVFLQKRSFDLIEY